MMKRTIFTGVLILFLSFGSEAQWKWVHPQPCGNYVLGMNAVDSLHACIVTAGGIIINTKDGGKNWKVNNIGSNLNVISVCFADSLRGWASAAGGTIFRTKDGGNTWSRSYVANQFLNDICFLDSLNGWLGTKYGSFIYHTTNGGISWDTVHFGISGGQNLSFPDSRHGWLGNDAVLYRTSDGGVTWQPLNTHPSWMGPSCFADSLTGFIISFYDGNLYKSNNGGQNWTKSVQPFLLNNTVYFSDNKHGWVAGFVYKPDPVYNEGRIVRSVDGGKSFTGVFAVSGRSYFDHVTASDSLHAWATGWGGMIFATRDGGVNWEQQGLSLGDPIQINEIFAIKNEHKAWAVGEPGIIYKTNNDGESWIKQDCGSDLILNTVYFWNANNGIIAGEAARIYKTYDGGANWEKVITPVQGDFNKIFFQSPVHGWLTAKRLIAETKDGGSSWDTNFTLSPKIDITDIVFSDSLHGWATGNNDIDETGESMIFRTTDGGKTWEVKDAPKWALCSLSFTDSLNGWICCKNGHLLHTTDGGSNWDTALLNSAYNLHLIRFIDPLHGWITGVADNLNTFPGGLVLNTNDGGKTWQRLDPGDGLAVKAMYFADPGFGYIAGDEGSILRWGDNPLGVNEPLPQAPGLELGNYPNPFRDHTTIRYGIAAASSVSLSIYNTYGTLVADLVEASQPAGDYSVSFRAGSLPRGIYFCRLKAGNTMQSKKLVIIN